MMTKEEFKKQFGVTEDSWHSETNYEPMCWDDYSIEEDGVKIVSYDVCRCCNTTEVNTFFYSFEEFLKRYSEGTLKD